MGREVVDDGARELAVLLVEDDEQDAQLLGRAMVGATVVGHVETLADAIAWLGARSADLVLLDLGLPDSVGLRTVHEVLAAHPTAAVVVLSGSDDDEAARTAVEAGAQEYVVKGSLEPQVLRRTLRHAVERHRLQSALRERSKEAACLQAVMRELHTDQSLAHLTAAIAGHLRHAMQHPADCRVRVTVDGTTAAAGPDRDPVGASLTAPITGTGRVRGRIEVAHVAAHAFLLPHKQVMLDGAAEAIAVWLGRHDALTTLERSEERLRVLVSQLPGLVWSTDRQLRTTSYDGSLLPQLGIGPDEYLGRSIVDLFESDPSAGSLEPFLAALRGEPSAFERHWAGRWWRNHVEPKRGPDGSILGVVCLSLDVSEEKEHEQALAETRGRLQGLFDNASDAMILAGDDAGYLDVNPAACELTGRTREELLGLRPWDLAGTDPVDAAAMWHDFREAGSMLGEFLIRRPDGTVVETEFSAVADIVPGVHLSVMRDVTDRRRMEADLAASEERFRAMAEAAQDAIYRFRTVPALAVDYVNAASAAISGFPIEAFHANPRLYLDRVHPDDAALLGASQLLDVGQATVTVRFRHADGHWIWLEDSRTAVLADGRVVGVQGVIRDVTARMRTERALQEALEAERRATEQLQASDQLKSHFLQAVSHELRTPLTSVLGLSETLLDAADRLDPDLARQLQERVVANARRLDLLLTDLLDLERLEHDAIRIDRSDTDLAALVAGVVEEVDLGDRELSVDVNGNARASVDPVRVGRIVHNLLTNAAKHTPPGTHVTVRCRGDEDGTTIEVADDGPGIPDDLVLAIFEPFRQGPASYHSASPGTGIGLSIVRQFAALHGGTAWVERTPGGGATFTVRLPLATDDDGPAGGGGTPLGGELDLVTRSAPGPGPDRPGPAGSRLPRPAAATSDLAIATALAGSSDGAVVDAAAVVAWATRELLTAHTRDEVAGVVLRAVHRLGGWTVPARVADEEFALPLDVSLGTGEPLLPAADPASVERMLLERHLPQLVADARATLDGVVRRSEHGPRAPIAAGAPRSGEPTGPADLERLVTRCRATDVLLVLDVEADALDDAGWDEAVRVLAACLKEQLRARDEAARLDAGGLAALLRDSDDDGAAALLVRLRASWERRRPDGAEFTVRRVLHPGCEQDRA